MNNADWWASKLGNQAPAPQQGRPLNIPTPPSQVPMQQMPVFQQQPQSKAASANKLATCPDCGSSNYFSATPQTSERCFECGYPIQQSGSRYGGLAGANVEGTATAARGNDATNNFNPQGIIGRA
jgi:hypothetical protein